MKKEELIIIQCPKRTTVENIMAYAKENGLRPLTAEELSEIKDDFVEILSQNTKDTEKSLFTEEELENMKKAKKANEEIKNALNKLGKAIYGLQINKKKDNWSSNHNSFIFRQ